MTTVTVSGFKIRKGERLYGTYVRYALYKATMHFGGADRAIRECGRESEDLV